MADYLNIAGRVRTTASDGVAMEAQEVKDLNQNKSQQEINADVQTELGDRYTKEETYNREEIAELVDPTNYVSVVATNATTAVTDILPATGEADTIYRVGNWNGTQYDPTMYALYAWNGSAYVCLAVRSFVGEVYDISVNHPDGQGNPTPYADLTAALGTNGANIPADIRRGGMSIKFIQGTVQSSDNKYVKFFCTADEFTTDVTKWQGVDDKIGNSKNLVTSGAVKAYIKPITDTIKTDETDALYVSDSDGNVIAKIDANGLSVTDVRVKSNSNLVSILTLLLGKVDKDGNKVLSDNNFTDALKEKLENISPISGIFDSYTDSLYVCDNSGNIIAKFDSEGLKAYKIKDAVGDMRIADGYQLFTIGDSLSAANKWQAKCSQILGCTFDPAGNIMPGMQLSTGGTITSGGAKDSAFFRVKNLYDQNVITNQGEKAIIVFENVNDANASFAGNISDTPMVPTTPFETGITEAEFNVAYLDSIKAEHGEINAIVALERTVAGKKMTITNLPTVEGDIKIGTGYSGSGMFYYNIHVVPQATEAETLAYVVDKILEYNYTGVSDFQGDEDNEILFTCGNPDSETYLTFEDIGNTGMAVTIENTDSAKQSILKYFIGESLDNWSNLDYWKSGSYLNIYRAYKSCVQYVIEKFPKAKVFLSGFPYLKLTPSSYLLANGTYDYEQYHNDANSYYAKNESLFTVLKNLSDYYDIPYLDVAGNLGINLSNYGTYYNNNNVHPKDIGYERMGSVIASEIKKYL